MLVTFMTDVHAEIPMFREDAHTMLKMMGHSGTIPGAILAADIPAALSRLAAAIQAENVTVPTVEDKEEDEDASEPAISLNHRALPLINLLTAAAKEGCNVMWK
ncbi:MAG: DUF1840 domain-containing protein [Nitrosomonas sp.]|nr:DUF1840 domain-containing protein [Nitrosomonas sp.]MDP1949747.1 DUF1840 domain-containing protein [Nitrosomonas sp.]